MANSHLENADLTSENRKLQEEIEELRRQKHELEKRKMVVSTQMAQPIVTPVPTDQDSGT